MAKRLCKLNRRDIADQLGDIHRLVSAPKFLCRSCARSSADKEALCKPAAIPPQSCQNKPIAEQKQCGLLAEALSDKASLSTLIEPVTEVESVSKADFKRVKKQAKQQKKQYKKLKKVLKKQQKLLKKHRKLEGKFAAINQRLEPFEHSANQGAEAVH